jgi:hypothetical protein
MMSISWKLLPAVAATVGSLMMVSGCGKSAEQIAAENAAGTAQAEVDRLNAERAEREQSERDAQATIAQDAQQITAASATIRSKLDPTGRVDTNAGTAFRWSVRFDTLDATRWVWTEQEEVAAAGDAGVAAGYDRLTYSVNPAQLSATVNLASYEGLPAVRISCSTGDCIHVTGVRGNPNGVDEPIDEYRDDNYFPLPNQFDAEAVGSAMRRILGIATRQAAPASTDVAK